MRSTARGSLACGCARLWKWVHSCTKTGLNKHTACIHTYIHTYIPTYIHTYIHAYTHTYIHTDIRTYIHTYIHACIHTYIHTYIHMYIQTHTQTHTHTYIHTYIDTYIHTYIHTYVRVRTYVHTYVRMYVHTSEDGIIGRNMWATCSMQCSARVLHIHSAHAQRCIDPQWTFAETMLCLPLFPYSSIAKLSVWEGCPHFQICPTGNQGQALFGFFCDGTDVIGLTNVLFTFQMILLVALLFS